MIEGGIIRRRRTVDDLGVVRDFDVTMIVLTHEDGTPARILRIQRASVFGLRSVVHDSRVKNVESEKFVRMTDADYNIIRQAGVK